ncbi:MAG: ribonuclease J, partial [Candidatus Curtissbacteria bacterium]
MTKKTRLSFSSISKDPALDQREHNTSGRTGATARSASGPTRSAMPTKKRTMKSSTYQYSKKRYGQSRKSPAFNKGPQGGKIPPPEKGIVRIIPLGGVEEVGKNMTAIEIGDDIIVVDAGMHFSTEATPGVDYVIPNTTYLEERKDKVRALIVTHAHLDHIGGAPLVLSRIGNPPVYSRNLSILMMRKRQAEFPHLPKMKENIVEKNDTITCGKIKVRFFGVTHTIPDSMGI